jgi:hypothetical protein
MGCVNKYRAKRTKADGMMFHSQREAERWQQLRLLEKAGLISNLQRQVSYECWVNGQRVCKWIADFVYNDTHKVKIVEDSKGPKTPEYKLKRKLMKACHGIDILET